jgi:CRP-like cAMP-binding protein
MADGKTVAVTPSDLEWLDGLFLLERYFNAWTPDGLKGVLPSFGLRSFSKGASIVKEGEAGTEVFILYKGSAGVQKGGKQIAQLGPGDFFGEMSFLKGAPRRATITALEDCVVFSMNQADLKKVFDQNVGIEERLEALARDRESEKN